MGRAPRRIRDAADQNATVRVTSPEPTADCDAAASVFSRRGNVSPVEKSRGEKEFPENFAYLRAGLVHVCDYSRHAAPSNAIVTLAGQSAN
jgi:hypothetical protein